MRVSRTVGGHWQSNRVTNNGSCGGRRIGHAEWETGDAEPTKAPKWRVEVSTTKTRNAARGVKRTVMIYPPRLHVASSDTSLSA